MNQNLEKATQDAKLEISKRIDEFKEKIEKGTSDTEHFITISEIEKEWADLRKSTDKMYSDMISAYLSNVNERELIKRKKEN